MGNKSGYKHSHTEHDHNHSGHDHSHTEHDHSRPGHHGHVHSPEEKKAVINRLSRAAGHLDKVKRMIDQDADCSDVLIQLAAVRNAINNTGKLILKNHLEHCIVHAIEEEDMDEIDSFSRAIEKFIK